jgi:hypothetical protein
VDEPEPPDVPTLIFDDLLANWGDWYATQQENEAVLSGALDGDTSQQATPEEAQ